MDFPWVSLIPQRSHGVTGKEKILTADPSRFSFLRPPPTFGGIECERLDFDLLWTAHGWDGSSRAYLVQAHLLVVLVKAVVHVMIWIMKMIKAVARRLNRGRNGWGSWEPINTSRNFLRISSWYSSVKPCSQYDARATLCTVAVLRCILNSLR